MICDIVITLNFTVVISVHDLFQVLFSFLAILYCSVEQLYFSDIFHYVAKCFCYIILLHSFIVNRTLLCFINSCLLNCNAILDQ